MLVVAAYGGVPENTESGEGPAAWWNEQYESEDTPWDTGAPQSALVDAVTEFGPSGRVLDIGCGTGTLAPWATKQGHPAVGVGIFLGGAGGRQRPQCPVPCRERS